jgi:hypothetical protein
VNERAGALIFSRLDEISRFSVNERAGALISPDVDIAAVYKGIVPVNERAGALISPDCERSARYVLVRSRLPTHHFQT